MGRDISKAEVKAYDAVYNGGSTPCYVEATYEGQKLTVKTSDAGVDGYVSYSNNTKVGYGVVTIRGMGDYYGIVSAQYKIVPPVVSGVAVTDVGQKRLTVSWSPALGAENYRVEISSDGGTTWEKVDVIAQTSIVVTGLNPSTEYSFRVYTAARRSATPGSILSIIPMSSAQRHSTPTSSRRPSSSRTSVRRSTDRRSPACSPVRISICSCRPARS